MFTFSGRREQARSQGGDASHVQYIIPGKGRTTRCGIATLSIGLGIGLLANACLVFFFFFFFTQEAWFCCCCSLPICGSHRLFC